MLVTILSAVTFLATVAVAVIVYRMWKINEEQVQKAEYQQEYLDELRKRQVDPDTDEKVKKMDGSLEDTKGKLSEMKDALGEDIKETNKRVRKQEAKFRLARASDQRDFQTGQLNITDLARLTRSPPAPSEQDGDGAKLQKGRKGLLHVTNADASDYGDLGVKRLWTTDGALIAGHSCLETGSGLTKNGEHEGKVCYSKLSNALDIVGKQSDQKDEDGNKLRRVKVHDWLQTKRLDSSHLRGDWLRVGKGGASFAPGKLQDTGEPNQDGDRTEFPSQEDGKNHVHGDTTVHGRLAVDGKHHVSGDLLVGEEKGVEGMKFKVGSKKLCIEGACVGKKELRKLKDLPDPDDAAVNKVKVGKVLVDGATTFRVRDVGFRPRHVSFTAAAGVENSNKNTAGNDGSDTHGNYSGFSSGYAQLNSSDEIEQQVVHSGVSGNSPNSTSYLANSSSCIGVRFAKQDGVVLGKILAKVESFDDDGFTLKCTEFDAGDLNGLLVLYTAYG